MESEPDSYYRKELFIKDENSLVQYAGNFRIKWIVTCEFPFKELEYFPYNPMNDNLPIK
jgi:hypothetical protein